MMTKVEEQLLQAEEHVGLGEEVELDELPDVAAHLHLGLDVNLILLPHLPPDLSILLKSTIIKTISNN